MKNLFVIITALGGALFALTASAQIQYSNEFWISTNATGNIYPSGGTLNSPLDGSTEANFDNNMNALPPHSTIHILAGTYQTYGDNAWIVKTGQKILGSGMDNTVLKLGYSSGNATNSYFVFTIGSFFPFVGIEVVSNAEVCDLTCNANFGSGFNTVGGVDLAGSFNAVRRVKVMNTVYSGPATGTSEAWGIVLEGDIPYSRGNIIEECEIDPYAGTTGGLSALVFDGCAGIIRDNRIFDTGGLAINCAGVNDVLIEGNYVDGANVGVYSDTDGYTNVIIAHNSLKNVFQGVTMIPANSPQDNITIDFNNIELAPTTTFASGGFNFWGGILTNVLIFGNTIGFSGTGPSIAVAIAANDITGLTFANNSVDPLIASNQSVSITNCSNVYMYNNTDLFGNYLPNLNIPSIGGTQVSQFGLSLISSAEASSALTNLGLPSNPATVITNNQTGVTLGGTFSGDGSGLTNVFTPSTLPIAASFFLQMSNDGTFNYVTESHVYGIASNTYSANGIFPKMRITNWFSTPMQDNLYGVDYISRTGPYGTSITNYNIGDGKTNYFVISSSGSSVQSGATHVIIYR